jgi:hypothetical protein
VSPPLAASAEPGAPGAGTGLPAELDAPLAAARALAGERRIALILSGSHASGESVWATDAGRRVSLSDLDLYAVMPDQGARREAERRAQQAPIPRTAGGHAAAIEVGFATREDLARLPARPGTIELKRHGRVLDGPAAVLADVPAWQGRDVSREEIERLIENRAYELLWGWLAARAPAALERLAGRHAVLKTALDLATVATLEAGEYPDGAEARVARARALRRGDPEPPWDEALAFRRAPAPALDADAEWLRTAAVWEQAWRRVVANASESGDPFDAARAAAARAPWRRRLRQAVTFRPRARGAAAPGLPERLARAAAGTPIHRLNASAACVVMLRRRILEAGGEPGRPADLAAARRSLAALGVLDPSLGPTDAARAALGLWDGWVLDGRRFGARP